MVASRRRTSSCSFFDRADQARQPLRQDDAGILRPLVRRQLDLHALLVGLGERHFAFIDGTVKQQPGRELHQPRRQPHAFGGVAERRGPIELLGFLPARTVEIGGGLFDELHAVAEQLGEILRRRELFAEQDRPQFFNRLFGHDVRLTGAEPCPRTCGEFQRRRTKLRADDLRPGDPDSAPAVRPRAQSREPGSF